jgi:DNA/RNA endonuclease G (NUC1)
VIVGIKGVHPKSHQMWIRTEPYLNLGKQSSRSYREKKIPEKYWKIVLNEDERSSVRMTSSLL